VYVWIIISAIVVSNVISLLLPSAVAFWAGLAGQYPESDDDCWEEIDECHPSPHHGTGKLLVPKS
jgi:hypothetical protein